MGLSKAYSRVAFEEHRDPTTLAAELARVLTKRLQSALDPEFEAHAILGDLRLIGHELWSWDESTDFLVYGDDYMRPGPTRFLLTLNWEEVDDDDPDTPDSPWAGVEFGPWPAVPVETPGRNNPQ